jgi:hypothetical protein
MTHSPGQPRWRSRARHVKQVRQVKQRGAPLSSPRTHRVDHPPHLGAVALRRRRKRGRVSALGPAETCWRTASPAHARGGGGGGRSTTARSREHQLLPQAKTPVELRRVNQRGSRGSWRRWVRAEARGGRLGLPAVTPSKARMKL